MPKCAEFRLNWTRNVKKLNRTTRLILRKILDCTGGDIYGECGARAYNGGLGAEPPAVSRGRAPGQGGEGWQHFSIWMLEAANLPLWLYFLQCQYHGCLVGLFYAFIISRSYQYTLGKLHSDVFSFVFLDCTISHFGLHKLHLGLHA